MAEIPTVKGSIDSFKLGVTLVHEHLCFRAPEKYQEQAMDYQVKLTQAADGYEDKIFISIDANWTFDEDGRVWHEAEKKHPETGKRTYAYAITHAAPMLMSAGVSLQRISKYLMDNPRCLFEALDS